MSQTFFDADVDPTVLADKTVALIGYGNQGRSHALNLRDNDVRVVVGNREDAYATTARADGWQVHPIADAAALGDVIALLIPDEVQPEVFATELAPRLRAGQCLIFAHGYNIFYGAIDPPPGLDVALVAPRMIGAAVRTRFAAGHGFPTLVAVEIDATGAAWPVTLAYARGIGGTRGGAIVSSFEEETVVDLFAEQVGGGSFIYSLLASFDVLTERGYNPEVVYHELFGSGELVEVMKLAVREGLIDQLWRHSGTSHYGQLTRGRTLIGPAAKEQFRQVLGQIVDGSFAREWALERQLNFPVMKRLRREAQNHPWFQCEEQSRRARDPDAT